MENLNYFIGSEIIRTDYSKSFYLTSISFLIFIQKNGIDYLLSSSLDFRIIYKDKRILCINDKYISNNGDVSLNRYGDVDFIDDTLFAREIKLSNELLFQKKINNIIVKKCGDVDVHVSDDILLQFISSYNVKNRSIFRIDRVKQSKLNEAVSPIKLFDIINVENDVLIEDLTNSNFKY